MNISSLRVSQDWVFDGEVGLKLNRLTSAHDKELDTLLESMEQANDLIRVYPVACVSKVYGYG
ncbi:MAG: hypothetical protein L0Y56_15460, partial [Nitrospira sp.]|nr:hypothetical protein [Nitrospira sp.]